MDHVWDGFYTGQRRKSMFPALLEMSGDYTIEYTGTPFNKMKYALRGSTGQIKVRVLYWNAGLYDVSVNGNKIEPTAFDPSTGQARELTGT